MDFSVIVPAHNEELLLAKGLAAIDRAAERVDGRVEVVVVANRCTDATAAIAAEAGAVVVTTSRATSLRYATRERRSQPRTFSSPSTPTV